MHRHDMLHLAVALHITAPRNGAAAVRHAGPNDETHDPRLVFNRLEDDSLGGARALADGDDARDLDPRTVGPVPYLGRGLASTFCNWEPGRGTIPGRA